MSDNDQGNATDYDELDDGTAEGEPLPLPPMNRLPNTIIDGRDTDDVDREETSPEQRERVFLPVDSEALDTDDTGGGGKSEDEEDGRDLILRVGRDASASSAEQRRDNPFRPPQGSRRRMPPSQLDKFRRK